jgi:hypothetical protein
MELLGFGYEYFNESAEGAKCVESVPPVRSI